VINAHRYPRIALADYLTASVCTVKIYNEAISLPSIATDPSNVPTPNRPMTTFRLIERLNRALSAEMIVVCDLGDCLFAAIDLRV